MDSGWLSVGVRIMWRRRIRIGMESVDTYCFLISFVFIYLIVLLKLDNEILNLNEI